MKSKMKNFLIWIFAFLLTVVTAAYQRMTGPTYPVSGTVQIQQGPKISYKLPTSYGGTGDAVVFLTVPDRTIVGTIKYRRVNSNDSLSIVDMKRVGDYLIVFIPHQPVAGKVRYNITLTQSFLPDVFKSYPLTKNDVVIRFRGDIPAAVLLPHILIIFLAMMFSTLTGLEALFRRKNTLTYTWITVITLFIGGLVLGPVVQKISFGVYWTGWPFGHDLTDNKSLIAFIFWVIALIFQYRNREKRIWPILAAIVLLVVFLIPHSILGSEIDYTKVQKTETHGN